MGKRGKKKKLRAKKLDYKKLSPEERKARRKEILEKYNEFGLENQPEIKPAFDMNLPEKVENIPLVEVEYVIPRKDVREIVRAEFNPVKEKFLKHLVSDYKQDLVDAGLSPNQIAQMADGKSPNGWGTHHKLPIHGGGKNEFSNYILIPHKEHGEIHRLVIDPQVADMGTGKAKIVKLPYPNEMIYNKNKEMTPMKAKNRLSEELRNKALSLKIANDR
jgi:hypothetical protein